VGFLGWQSRSIAVDFVTACRADYIGQMLELALLVLAAVLEVGGDALIRGGLKGGGVAAMAAGVVVLGLYGFMVNLTKLDFGRLMGMYIVLFFLVAQVVSVAIFKEKTHPSVVVGGALIVAGGVLMTVWRPA
jgi:small multidrug resistance family-3 protein